MKILATLLKGAAIGIFALVILHLVYIPKRDGILKLPNAPRDEAAPVIMRDKETGMHHIKADSLNSAFYA